MIRHFWVKNPCLIKERQEMDVEVRPKGYERMRIEATPGMFLSLSR
jgi:hypothetical protein